MPLAALADHRLILIAAIGLAYATAFPGTFQFDDWQVIVRDGRVQSLTAWWASMPGIRPLLKLSYALNNAAGGLAGFHAVNVAAHAGSALLVRELLIRLGRRHGLEDQMARRCALVAALLFSLHPVQTEAVTYLSGRSVSLSGFLVLGSLLAWVAAGERGEARRSTAATALLFTAALAVRETVIVLPVAAMLWLATDPQRAFRLADAWRATAAMWAVVIAAMAAMALLPAYRSLLETSLSTRGMDENLWLQAQAIVWLSGQILRPDLLNADPALEAGTGLAAALAAATTALAIAAGVALLRRAPLVAFGILWFFIWLAPTNSLLPRLDLVNDRQLYLALIGPAWLAALALAELSRRWRAARALAALLALALCAATAARNLVYWDEIRFWEDVTSKSPGNARALNNLGYAYVLAGRNADAESSFGRALSVAPGDVRAAANLRLLREGALTPLR